MSVKNILDDFGQNLVRLATINLGANRRVNGRNRRINSSGQLRDSLDYSVVKTDSGFRFVFVMEEYGAVVDAGRKAGKGVPIADLKEWIRIKPIRYRDAQGRFRRMTDARLNTLTFLINRKIKRDGIAPTNFLSQPFDKLNRDLPENIQQALLTDIVEVLDLSFDNLKSFK